MQEQKLDNPICDFCSNPHPTYWYPCEDFEALSGHRSVGPWAACKGCHSLIEAGNYEGLSGWSLESFYIQHPQYEPDPAIEKQLKCIHEGFRQHRTGPAQLIEENQ